jgi:hypothetical protein
MRKFVWAGTAVVVLGAAAVYYAADFAARNPDSWFGRCTYVAAYIGSKCNPFAGISAAVAHRCPSDGVTEVCAVVQKPKPDAIPEEQEPAAVQGGDVDEPIRVEPQAGFVMPFEPEDAEPVVPPSEETPEPTFGPGEESEVPTEVAAPASDTEEAVPPAMPYVEDDVPACKKGGSCGKCGGSKDCCEKCNKGSDIILNERNYDTPCDRDCCEKCEKCDKGCCAKDCCDWFLSFFGIKSCGKCCNDQPAPSDAEGQDEGTATRHDDVPNCQEDPAYDHQYPSCPFMSCPYPYAHHAVVTTNDAVQPKKKKTRKKPATSPQGQPATKKPGCGEGATCPGHPDVDTMEARPSDVEPGPFGDGPF